MTDALMNGVARHAVAKKTEMIILKHSCDMNCHRALKCAKIAITACTKIGI